VCPRHCEYALSLRLHWRTTSILVPQSTIGIAGSQRELAKRQAKLRNQNLLKIVVTLLQGRPSPQSLAWRMTGECKADVTRNGGPFLSSRIESSSRMSAFGSQPILRPPEPLFTCRERLIRAAMWRNPDRAPPAQADVSSSTSCGGHSVQERASK
jgi:hypothetical protein